MPPITPKKTMIMSPEQVRELYRLNALEENRGRHSKFDLSNMAIGEWAFYEAGRADPVAAAQGVENSVLVPILLKQLRNAVAYFSRRHPSFRFVLKKGFEEMDEIKRQVIRVGERPDADNDRSDMDSFKVEGPEFTGVWVLRRELNPAELAHVHRMNLPEWRNGLYVPDVPDSDETNDETESKIS